MKKKNKKKFPPDKAFELTREEKKLIGNTEDYKPVSKEKKKQILKASQKALQDKRVNLRISSKLLSEIKAEADRKGLNYQALMKSVLHQYINGDLVEKRN